MSPQRVGPHRHRKSPRAPGWISFVDQTARNLTFWLIGVALLAAFRLVMIFAFRERMGPGSGAGQIAAAVVNGFRFDGQVVFYWGIVPFLFSTASGVARAERWAESVRRAFLFLFLASSIPLCAVTIAYFREFDDQFNHFLLGVVHDDFTAVLITIWKEYPVVLIVSAILLAVFTLYRLSLRMIASVRLPESAVDRLPGGARILLAVLLLLVLAFVSRGSFGRRPLQSKDIAITADPFLNKTVLNPFRALYGAVQDYRVMTAPGGIHVLLPDGDIRKAVRNVIGRPFHGDELSPLLVRRAPGAINAPRHLFLVVMESYSAWPLLSPYRSLGIAREMERLGGTGLLTTHFLSGGTGTMTSLAPLLAGLADPVVKINYQPSSRKPYSTSIAPIFRELGFRTRFFYGGHLSWERIGDFAKGQGFDEVHGGGMMEGRGKGNEWGVEDKTLFDYVLRTVRDESPSFNVVLSGSNHPPYDVDPFSEGFPLREIPADLKGIWDGSVSVRELGHFWYSDRCLGGFVDAAETALPNVLFAVTSDHYGRRFLHGRPTLAERSMVPFLLHGSRELGIGSLPTIRFGSHLDIPATLVDLAAPAGFRYHALGRNLLAPGKADAAFGSGFAVGRDFVAAFGSRPIREPLDGNAPPSGGGPDLPALSRRNDDFCAVSWWMVMKGDRLPPEGK